MTSSHLAMLRLFAISLGLLALARGAEADELPKTWALQPLARPPVPTPDDSGIRNPIDAFVHARLKRSGLRPSPEANRRTLIRRLYFDLLGLPPSPAEIDAFLKDESLDAYERLVDRLLASPHYGERWARHWMDAVHFAETHGHDQDRVRPNAWPYRDYLIAAFNEDRRYERFVQEQIAADALFPTQPELMPALGLLAAGPWDESSLRDIREDSIDRQVGHYLDRDDMVGTVISTFSSLTIHCARCHDHKFDPITQEDYYALQAVFAGVGRADRTYDLDWDVHRQRRELRGRLVALEQRTAAVMEILRSDALAAEMKQWEEETRIANSSNPKSAGKLPEDVAKALAVPRGERSQEQRDIIAAHYLRSRIEAEVAKLPTPRLVYAAGNDFAPDGSHKPPRKPRTVHVLKRGDINRPAQEAKPGTLECVSDLPARFTLAEPENEEARRAALAHWITHPKNPLPWRSIVNRVWHHHFGRGIVDTPNDFGAMGGRPSHPELLDWLAVEFRDGDQSLKQLHRLIVTSATYRQTSAHRVENARLDADNRLLWRVPRTRLDAESVRDAILLASERLDPRMGGPSEQQFTMKPGLHVTPLVDYPAFNWDRPEKHRRSVYRLVFRTLPDPLVDCLDGADPSQLTPARNTSITPLQSLALMNNAFVLSHSKAMAGALERAAPDEPRRISMACERVWGRPPTGKELAEMQPFAQRHGLANLCRLLFNSNEFLFVN